MRSKLAVIGLSALAALGIACGVGSGQTSSSAGGDSAGPDVVPVTDGGGAPAEEGPVTVALGQTVTLTNTFLGNTTKLEVTLDDPRQDPGGQFLGPQHGLYYAVRVTIVCAEGSYTANPGGFKFVAADGTVFDWTISGAFEPTLSFTELNAGQRVSGYVVFDVAPGALDGGKIQMDGIGLDFDEPAAYWTL
jgi:hypothetical protein